MKKQPKPTLPSAANVKIYIGGKVRSAAVIWADDGAAIKGAQSTKQK